MNVVIYTDGSFKTNVEGDMTLGSYGSGAHGYVYDETKELKITTDSPHNFYITTEGYVVSNEYNPDIYKAVSPCYYIDASYSFLNKGTIGKAELLAISCVIRSILENRNSIETETSKLNNILVLSDSTYAIGEVDRANTYPNIEEYKKYLKPDTPNSDILLDIKILLNELAKSNIKIQLDKVAAHSMHIGNDIADDLAYLARELSGNHKLVNLCKIYKIEKGKRYWNYSLEEYELLKFKQLFFTNSLRANGTEVIYSIMNYKTDVEPGTRTHDAMMGLVCLKHSPEIIEDAIEEYHRGLRTMSILSVVNLKNLYSRDVSYYYDMFGRDLFTFIYSKRELLKRNIPIVTPVRSSGLANKLLMDMQFMYKYITYYRDISKDTVVEDTLVNNTIRYINITNVFYDLEKKKKSCIVPQGSTFIVVDSEWDGKPLKFPLSLGKDILERNQFKRLESTDIKVYAVIEKMSDKSYRYYTLIKSDGNIGIYANLYSNKIITE